MLSKENGKRFNRELLEIYDELNHLDYRDPYLVVKQVLLLIEKIRVIVATITEKEQKNDD